jgi:hypothetical protein
MAELIDREKLAGCYISIATADQEGWSAMLLGLEPPQVVIEYADDPVAAIVRLARRLQATPAKEAGQ